MKCFLHPSKHLMPREGARCRRSYGKIRECKQSGSYFTLIQSYLFSEYGIGYGWNPQTIVINVGDFVQVVRTAWNRES